MSDSLSALAPSPGYSAHVIAPVSPRRIIPTANKVEKGRDESGNKTINMYTVIETLGVGSSAKVKLARHIRTKKDFAIKVMNRSVFSRHRTASQNVQREIAIMKTMNHPNLVQLHEVIDDPDCNKLYLIMEHASKGPVYVIGTQAPLDTESIRRYAGHICTGLQYLHAHHVVHRDIKPANILVDAHGTAMLSDFGVSGALDDVVAEAKLEGSPAFLSPELLKGDPCPSYVMNDVWALGVTLYTMTYGDMPFPGNTILSLRESTANHEVTFAPPCGSHELEDLLRHILHKDPSQRLDLEGVMTHPFLRNVCKERCVVDESAIAALRELNCRGAMLSGNNIHLRLAITAMV
jgi:[calcium/calmodulin-dependent protein kinase] kinase